MTQHGPISTHLASAGVGAGARVRGLLEGGEGGAGDWLQLRRGDVHLERDRVRIRAVKGTFTVSQPY